MAVDMCLALGRCESGGKCLIKRLWPGWWQYVSCWRFSYLVERMKKVSLLKAAGTS